MAVTRTVIFERSLDLSKAFLSLRVPVPTGKAVRVDGQAEYGTWANRTFTIKIGPGPTPRDFASAKTIPAAGGIAQMSVDEMRGVSELWLGFGGTADAAGVWASLTVTIEEEDGR